MLRTIAILALCLLTASAAGPALAATSGPGAAGLVAGVGPESSGEPGPPVAAPFALPVPPPAEVLTGFRPPPRRYGTGHRGVDLAAVAGSTIRAAGAGVVVFAGVLAGRGVVSVQHPGGLRTTYEPVAATVEAGTAVAMGAALGTLEPGHPSCAPRDCLHWGARLPDGTYLDPMGLLQPWRVRLLPWDPPG